MRLPLILAILLLASTQLLSQTIDVTATIPDRFKNFFKSKEYDESPYISDYQRQRIITLQTPTPSIPDDQINADDDVALHYTGFYADANGNPSPYVNSVTQFIVSLELTGDDAHKYNLTNPTVSFAATITQQILRSSSQPEAVAFQKAFSEFTLTTQDTVVETDKFTDLSLGFYRLHADSVPVYSSPKGFTVYATKGKITTPKKLGSGRTIMIYYAYVGNPNYTLGFEGKNYCTSCGSVVKPFMHFYIKPDSIVTYGTVITLHSIEADKGKDVGHIFTMTFKSSSETGLSIASTQDTNPIPAGNHILTGWGKGPSYSETITHFNVTVLPRTLSLSSTPTLPSRLYDATTTLTTPSLPTLIPTNLHPTDSIPAISFTIDSSAVRPYPGTYPVLFHAHLSNPNYALTDSLFSVPFTITPRPKQPLRLSLTSTSAIYGDDLPIAITPDIPGTLTSSPTTPLSVGTHSLTLHFLPQDTLDYSSIDTTLSITILPRTLSLSSTPTLPSRLYDATTTLTTPSLPTLISTDLHHSDTIPALSFTIDSSAVRPYPGTYPVLFHAHLSNPNYALTDSLFSVPFTITVAHQPIPTLTPSSLSTLTKVYDGTISLPLADLVPLSPYAQISAARLASSNVGDHAIFVDIVSTDPYVLFPNDSTTISNYPYPAQGTITPCPLSLVGEMSSPGKSYDATTIVPDSIVNLPSISGIINNEKVRIAIQSLSFASKDATDNTITATISLSGADADNYTLPTTQISCPATISPLQLYATAPIFSSTSKEYDSSIATPSVISAPTPIGIIPSDDVTLYFTARYDSPNPGPRTIIVSYSLSGADAHNYLAPAPISIPSEITTPEPTPEPEPEPEPTPTPTPKPTPTPISASLVISNSNSSAPNDAFCPGEQLTLSLSVSSGEPVAFSLASSSPAIHDVPLSPIPDDFIIRIPITSSSSYGLATALLALFDSSRVATTQIPLSLTIRPGTSFVDFSYGNTLSICDPSRFTSFQWMSNNSPIAAATKPSYYANPLAPAAYTCRVVTPDGLSLQTCPLVINASPTTPVTLSVTPNPVRTCSPLTIRLANAGQTLSVKVFDTYGNPQETHTVLNGAPFTITVDQGTYILLVSDGNTSAVSKILVK